MSSTALFVLDWIITIAGVVLLIVWAIWFAMRAIKAYALAEGSGWLRLQAALVAVLSASWATVTAPFRLAWMALRSKASAWFYRWVTVISAIAVALANAFVTQIDQWTGINFAAFGLSDETAAKIIAGIAVCKALSATTTAAVDIIIAKLRQPVGKD